MENSKICPNCKKVNELDSKFCSNCGKDLIENINNNVVKNNSDDMEGTKLGIISLLLYFGGTAIIMLISSFLPTNVQDSFSSLSGIFSLAGIVVMIIGRVKYPTNKLLKVVMWVIIASIILCLILFIIIVMWCYMTCVSIDTRGCA